MDKLKIIKILFIITLVIICLILSNELKREWGNHNIQIDQGIKFSDLDEKVKSMGLLTARVDGCGLIYTPSFSHWAILLTTTTKKYIIENKCSNLLIHAVKYMDNNHVISDDRCRDYLLLDEFNVIKDVSIADIMIWSYESMDHHPYHPFDWHCQHITSAIIYNFTGETPPRIKLRFENIKDVWNDWTSRNLISPYKYHR